MRSKVLSILARVICRYYLYILFLTIILTGINIYLIKHLPLKTDYIDLLPVNLRSVQDAKRITKMAGGMGYLIVVIEADDTTKVRPLADEIASRLETLPGIGYVTYRYGPEVTEFFKRHALLYVEEEDLREINRRLTRKIELNGREANPFYIPLTGESDEITFDDLVEKYETKLDLQSASDGYFESKDHRMIVLLTKPIVPVTDHTSTKKLAEQVRKVINEVNPARFGPGVKVGLSGDYMISLEGKLAIIDDLNLTSVLALCGIILSLLFLLRNLMLTFLLGMSLLVSLSFTFGAAYLAIGELNLITAFLMSILMGLGIDFGIHFVSRFLEERASGHDLHECIRIGVAETGEASLTSAITTACAFFALTITDFKGFSQFGVIAGLGIIFAFISMYFFLPALIIATEKVKGKIGLKDTSVNSARRIFTPRSFSPRFKLYPLVLIVGTLALIGLGYPAMQTGFDYNSRNLEVEGGPSILLADKIMDRFNISLHPSAAYSDTLEEIRLLEKKVAGLKKNKANLIDHFSSLAPFIPPKQVERLKLIKDIGHTLEDDRLDLLDDKDLEFVNDLREKVEVTQIGAKELPVIISREYLGLDPASKGYLSYIYPKTNLWNKLNARHFAGAVRSIKLEDGREATSTGKAIIFSDMMDMIKRDGTRAFALTLLVVLLVLWLDFRNLTAALLTLSPLLTGIVFMLGLMNLLGLKLNFMNLIVLPMILGIGVDSGVHIYHRYMEEGAGSIMLSVIRTGRAVTAASLTTMIGFSALLLAKYRGLNSMGSLALLGIGSTLISALLILPALLQWRENRGAGAEERER
ncbi:MAG: MMPL family transporter [bacterium]|nr:MMPL family transporter [bacterium]